MVPSLRPALGAWFALALLGNAGAQTPTAPSDRAVSETSKASAMDGELFLQLLLGELQVAENEPASGFALMLDAARRTNDPDLYRRSVEIALRARSGDAALQAARAWRSAHPQSREANRTTLQILLALNRVADSAEPLRREIALTPLPERGALIAALPRSYARVSDKKLAATVVEQALGDALTAPGTGAVAWTTVGRLRLASGDTAGALDAARRGQAVGPRAEGPALLALDLMEASQAAAEPLVRRYLEGPQALVDVRMGYARALLDAQRYAESQQQLEVITRERPDFAEAWLVQGSLLVQDNRLDAGERALKRYLELSASRPAGEERSRGQAQAYLALAQVAEKRKDYALATAWLDRIDSPQDLLAAQNRRASLLARQGKLDEARRLLRTLPERNPAEARMKLMAEVALLREHQQYKPAFELLGKALAQSPQDTDLLYDQAMLAEKMNDLPLMEKLLRQVMTLKPDHHHAYNALGYSLADRGMRLAEARELVQKALSFAPDDPFIRDSLGWVEFRMGNKDEALRILEAAYRRKPDAEIAAHLGEVLWSLGQRDRAQEIWREGLLLNNENETLLEVLKRFRVRP